MSLYDYTSKGLYPSKYGKNSLTSGSTGIGVYWFDPSIAHRNGKALRSLRKARKG